MKHSRVPSLGRSWLLQLGTCLLAIAVPAVLYGQEEKDAPPAEEAETEVLMEFEEGAPFIPGLEVMDEESDPESSHPASKLPKVDPQRLLFSNGNTLHGSLIGINSQRREVLWQRSDISAPISFPLGEITSLSVTGDQAPATSGGKVTVKLTGSDWLTADGVALKDGKLQVRLGGLSPMLIDRDRVEWIYFSKGAAPECYDGPTSMAGWISDGSWTFREGALRAVRPGAIGRQFEVLPDLVEYYFELDQNGGFQAFSVNLRGNQAPARGIGQGRVQLMFSATDLRMWAQVEEEMKMEQVDLRTVLGPPGNPDAYRPPRNRAVQYRILEDFPGGRLIIIIDGRKAAEWKIGKGAAGKNRGGFTFQPMVWNIDSQQSLSRVRVLPWDGVVPADGERKDDRADTDSVLLTAGDTKKGEAFELGASKLKLRTGGTATEVPREQIRLLRFRRTEDPPDEDAAVARVRLARRGEFDVSGMNILNGHLATRTSFGGDVSFPLGAIRTVEFAGTTATVAPVADVLVFKNGDRLKGTFEGIVTGEPVRWRTADGKTSVEIQTGNVLGVHLASRAEPPAAKPGVLARFRNGDLLSGEFVGLDGERLLLNSVHAGPLGISREHLRALYFSNGGPPPVLDGSMDSDLWISGAELRRASEKARSRPPSENTTKAAADGPWRYFNGSFTFQRPERNAGYGYRGNIYLARLFEAMPQSVEISLHVTAQKMAPAFSLQLFSEPNNPGYMVQCYSEGIFLHDMSPRARGQAVFQQQFPFEGKLLAEVPHRHLRILADRPSGKIVFMVDGIVVGQVVRKPSEGARNLGRGFMLLPQSNVSCTFSDLWIGPWNGLIPGREPAGAQENEHSVLLANGDETRGTALSASATVVHFQSEVGPVDLPIARLTMLDLGASPIKPERGVRLRLVGRGALTVTSCRIENGSVTCQSPLAGELHLPLSAVQEIALEGPGTGIVSQKKAR